MKKEDIIDILNAFNNSDLSSLIINDYDFKLELKKSNCKKSNDENYKNNQFLKSASNEGDLSNNKENSNNVIVTSPIVASFYTSPSPDEKPFVKIGDFVKEGDTIFILEAMKMINEIKAPVSGIISNIFVKNGELVEFNQKIMEIEVSK